MPEKIMEMPGKRIRRYIERTKADKARERFYVLFCEDMAELFALAELDTIEAICLAYDYGRAKGYRMARRS